MLQGWKSALSRASKHTEVGSLPMVSRPDMIAAAHAVCMRNSSALVYMSEFDRAMGAAALS